jgi:hypothetical protein
MGSANALASYQWILPLPGQKKQSPFPFPLPQLEHICLLLLLLCRVLELLVTKNLSFQRRPLVDAGRIWTAKVGVFPVQFGCQGVHLVVAFFS